MPGYKQLQTLKNRAHEASRKRHAKTRGHRAGVVLSRRVQCEEQKDNKLPASSDGFEKKTHTHSQHNPDLLTTMAHGKRTIIHREGENSCRLHETQHLTCHHPSPQTHHVEPVRRHGSRRSVFSCTSRRPAVIEPGAATLSVLIFYNRLRITVQTRRESIAIATVTGRGRASASSTNVRWALPCVLVG